MYRKLADFFWVPYPAAVFCLFTIIVWPCTKFF